MFITVSKWIGPEIDNYKFINKIFSTTKQITNYIPTNESHIYQIQEWNDHPNKLGSSIINTTNAEEFLAILDVKS